MVSINVQFHLLIVINNNNNNNIKKMCMHVGKRDREVVVWRGQISWDQSYSKLPVPVLIAGAA